MGIRVRGPLSTDIQLWFDPRRPGQWAAQERERRSLIARLNKVIITEADLPEFIRRRNVAAGITEEPNGQRVWITGPEYR